MSGRPPLVEGVPTTITASPDGRCCALTVARDAGTKLHVRCQRPAETGRVFCGLYHTDDDARTSGTVWHHKPTCLTCRRSTKADPHEQPSQTTYTMIFAPELDMDGGASHPHTSRKASLAGAVATATLAPVHSAAVTAVTDKGRPPPLAIVPPTPPASTLTTVTAGGSDTRECTPCNDALLAPYNTLLFTPRSETLYNAEKWYVGPSGIRLHVRLARTLQPVNWCVDAPTFRTCLHSLMPSTGHAHGQGHGLGTWSPRSRDGGVVTPPTPPSTVAKRRREHGSDDETGCLPPPPTIKRPRRSMASPPRSRNEGDGDEAALASPATTPPPGGAVSMDEDRELLEVVLAASLSIDLAAAPVGGDSWLTSILIDFVALQFARRYPQAHFLPSNFLGYELGNAMARLNATKGVAGGGGGGSCTPTSLCSGGGDGLEVVDVGYVPRDLLHRPVNIAPDALPPVVVPWGDASLAPPRPPSALTAALSASATSSTGGGGGGSSTPLLTSISAATATSASRHASSAGGPASSSGGNGASRVGGGKGAGQGATLGGRPSSSATSPSLVSVASSQDASPARTEGGAAMPPLSLPAGLAAPPRPHAPFPSHRAGGKAPPGAQLHNGACGWTMPPSTSGGTVGPHHFTILPADGSGRWYPATTTTTTMPTSPPITAGPATAVAGPGTMSSLGRGVSMGPSAGCFLGVVNVSGMAGVGQAAQPRYMAGFPFAAPARPTSTTTTPHLTPSYMPSAVWYAARGGGAGGGGMPAMSRLAAMPVPWGMMPTGTGMPSTTAPTPAGVGPMPAAAATGPSTTGPGSGASTHTGSVDHGGQFHLTRAFGAAVPALESADSPPKPAAGASHATAPATGGAPTISATSTKPTTFDDPYVWSPRPPHYIPPTYTSSNRPLIFFWNIGNMHWNLIRVHLGTRKEIEIYEPMGRLTSRSRVQYKSEGLSLRSVPPQLLSWLDAVCPLPTVDGWKARTVSAITAKHQGNGFDCGVACLLYAEKCAQGMAKEDVMATTDQEEISEYRQLLAAYFESQRARLWGHMDSSGGAGTAAPATTPSGSGGGSRHGGGSSKSSRHGRRHSVAGGKDGDSVVLCDVANGRDAVHGGVEL